MLLNKKEVRRRILAKVKRNRLGWECTRVSETIILQLEARLDGILDRAVHAHPSTGKTFKQLL
ncbi:hypothetical protein LCGC14_0487150 [marine sediment metagenome]|uniref:Uncharacterized protein n=1 Tax=marine sediment metagenome TaxID=412755 RepID=A0A0F9UUN2_9ZZZZ